MAGVSFGNKKIPFWNENLIQSSGEKQRREEKTQNGLLLTNTSIPVQHQTGLAGTFEAAQRVQTVSVLADALHGALVDIFKVGRCENEKVILIYCEG